MAAIDTSKVVETRPCTRCGGSGQYSYNQTSNTTCFKCNGKGQHHTKRGKAVYAWIGEQVRTDALSVEVGDRVSYDDYASGKRHTFTIAAIEELAPIHCQVLRDGVMVPYEQRHVELVTESGRRYPFGGPVRLTRVITPELRTRARAYRDSLTLAGRPRKVK